MSKIEVDLPPVLADFLKSQVEAGLSKSVPDAIEDAVRRVADDDWAEEQVKLEAIRAALAPGLAEADAGVYFDGGAAEIMAAARKRWAEAK